LIIPNTIIQGATLLKHNFTRYNVTKT